MVGPRIYVVSAIITMVVVFSSNSGAKVSTINDDSLIMAFSSSTETAPHNQKICRLRGANLNGCMEENIYLMKPLLSRGIPELGIPPCEPLRLGKIVLQHKLTSLIKTSEYSDIILSGISNFTITSLDVSAQLTVLKTFTPLLHIESKCALTGKIMQVPIYSSGLCRGNYSDVETTIGMKFKVYFKKGEKYIECTELHVDMNVGVSSVKMFDENEAATSQGHAVTMFNEDHWTTMADELQPTVTDMLSTYFMLFVNGVYGKTPSSALFSEF